MLIVMKQGRGGLLGRKQQLQKSLSVMKCIFRQWFLLFFSKDILFLPPPPYLSNINKKDIFFKRDGKCLYRLICIILTITIIFTTIIFTTILTTILITYFTTNLTTILTTILTAIFTIILTITLKGKTNMINYW